MRTSHRGLKLRLLCTVLCSNLAFSAHAQPTVEGMTRAHPEAASVPLGAGDATPSWSAPRTAPASAPNVVLIMLDDIGFSDTSTFGGVATTPVLDKLAADSLIYNRFHTTSICSASRAALLTGRNPHRVGWGSVGEIGFPGYNGIWNKSTASVAEMLRENGYSTAAFGKWHNTPFREITPIGPFDNWPTHLGFDYFYGNMLGATSEWEPLLWRNTVPIQQPKSRADGYHFTDDAVDEAVRWMNTQRALAPDRPYFLYFAPTAVHMPHQAPAAWIAPYKGRFDEGWDQLREDIFVREKKLGVIPQDAKLTPRPPEIPAWSSLPPATRRAMADQMEAYAGFISHTDHEIGRLIDAVRAAPGGENTLIIYIVGDNGSAGELGVEDAVQFYNFMPDNKTDMYAQGWAWAGSTPFQWSKGVASHLGGTRNPMLISWPARFKYHHSLRTQFTDINDVAPTILDVAGIQMPTQVDGVTQQPIDGVSFAYSFDAPKAPSRHRVQYFETWGNRAIYSDGWMASARHGIPWRMKSGATNLDGSASFEADRWELYDLAKDFSQATDVAAEHPDKVVELKSLFDREARANNVYPLVSNNLFGTFPPAAAPQTEVTYHSGTQTFLALSGPDVIGKSFEVDARVDVPQSGAEGVIFSRGRALSLYMKDRVLFAQSGAKLLKSNTALPAGSVDIRFVFNVDPSRPKPKAFAPTIGKSELFVNGALADQAPMAMMQTFLDEVDIGQDTWTPGSRAYKQPFPFTGRIDSVTVKAVSAGPARSAGS